ncbi:MAG: glucans biosynthesis glucosyltransferase MdoH, partial [Pseudomonadota bacterium]
MSDVISERELRGTGSHAQSVSDQADENGMHQRRAIVLGLNAATVAALVAAMMGLMSYGGITALEWAMLLPYAMTLPWLSIGLWNSLIGFWLDRTLSDAPGHVTPALRRVTGREPVASRVAVVMALRNEDADAALQRLRSIARDLSATPWSGRFDFHILSDSDHADIALREETLFAMLRKEPFGARVFYRRREENPGYKAGNIAEFVSRCHADYDYFLPLDADSSMSAAAILRLVRVMQKSPEIGMLQGLVVGHASRTFFTRAFQFGMRQGMRSFTLGSAWWQGDCGPSWGHNLLIRMQPFHAQCMLPKLSGQGPLSGWVLSHDQLEAALMRRAGFEVRVVAEEDESFEENPPSVVDFIRRELRWCNGNMQYLRLLGLPGLKPVSRIQLLLAIQMYLAAPAWILFVLMGAALAAAPAQVEAVPLSAGLGFFALIMTLNLMPKLMGLGQVLFDRARSESYGGRGKVVVGGAAEIFFSMLIAPAVAVALARFLAGLFVGQRIGWSAQQRSRERLDWDEATHVLWPQTILGVGLTLWIGYAAPWALWIAGPMLFALVFAIPIAVISAAPALGRWSTETGLFDIPEEVR